MAGRGLRRRLCLAALGLLALPLQAAPSGGWRVGVLHPGAPPREAGGALDRFRAALLRQGLVEGRDLRLDLRFDELQPALLQAQVAELVAAPVDLIVAGTTVAARVAKQATARIPIVMAVSADPVADGLVASLARPGGNVTGMSIVAPQVTARRLQLLTEIVPGLQRVALMLDTGSRWASDLREHEAAARTLGLQLLPLKIGSIDDVGPAFEAARRGDAKAVILAQSITFVQHRAQVAALALAHRLPTVSGSGDTQFARAGGLMNYGVNIAVSWERAASFVRRILDGADPASLPVEQPDRFELALNLRTAELLGLALPTRLLLLADEVVRN